MIRTPLLVLFLIGPFVVDGVLCLTALRSVPASHALVPSAVLQCPACMDIVRCSVLSASLHTAVMVVLLLMVKSKLNAIDTCSGKIASDLQKTMETLKPFLNAVADKRNSGYTQPSATLQDDQPDLTNASPASRYYSKN